MSPTTAPPAQTAKETTATATSQRARLARSGLIAFVGSVVNGIAAFGVVLAITRGLNDTASSGAVFLAMAVFNIAYIVCTLGADVAVVRAVARNDSPEAPIVRAALVPTVVLSLVVAIAVGWWRGSIADLLGDGATEAALSQSLLAIAPFIPAASITTVLIATTRGRGTMTPTAIVERISRPGAQLVLLAGDVVALQAMLEGMFGIKRRVEVRAHRRNRAVVGIERGFPLHGIQVGDLDRVAGGFQALDGKVLERAV